MKHPEIIKERQLVIDTSDFIDRVVTGKLPENGQKCQIITHDAPLADSLEEAIWYPYSYADYPENQQPAQGYLGQFLVIKLSDIGYNVWEQNESEIRYWKPVTE